MEPFTLPQPLEPDIEIHRQSGNLSLLPPLPAGNCTGAAAAAAGRARCPNRTLITLLEGDPLLGGGPMWAGASADVLHYAMPVVLGWGALSGLVSAVVVLRHLRTSQDGYLLGYFTAATLLLAVGGALKVQDYMPHSNAYHRAAGNLKSVHDWLWLCALWTLVVMTLERGLAVAHPRGRALCTTVQAGVVVGLVYTVSLISALPQFWEYEASETFDYITNQTLVISQLSKAAASPEYKIMYFWYIQTITVFLPYPVMLVLMCVLWRGMRRARRAHRRLAAPHSHSTTRRLAEELHVTRCFLVLLLFYLLLTSPLSALIMLHDITPAWSWTQDSLLRSLHPIFELVFYFYFAISGILLASYSDRFRYALLRTCCCCCCVRKSKAGGGKAGPGGGKGSSRPVRHKQQQANYYVR